METLQRTANRGSISTGYDIDNSWKLEADNNERMQRASATIGTPTNAKIATLSFWAKRTELISNNAHFSFIANAGADSSFICFEQDKARVYTTGGNSLMSNALFRDTSAWYHFVAAFDMTQGTASNRVKIYINGVQITSFQTETYGTQNNDIGLYDLNMSHYIGYAGSQGFNGYITELNLIDGQQLAPTEFGETDEDSGIWKPKAYDGTYGNEGYYLDMSNASNLGEDQSGNDNDFGSLYNITSADQATDTPTNNFCTMNVLDRTDGNIKNQEGATKITTDGGSSWCNMLATMGITKGKWYWEAQRASSDGNNVFAGVADSQDFYIPYNSAAKYYLGNVADKTSVGWYFDNGQVYNGDATFAAPSADDKVMIALDFDNQAIYFGVNGTWGNSSNPESGASKTGASVYAFNNADWDNFAMPAFTVYQGNTLKVNFGGYTCMSISSAASDGDGYGTFEYAPPTGYYALCTKNLAEYG